MSESISKDQERSASNHSSLLTRRESLPMLLNISEVAELLRTTPKAVYALVERRQIPGVTRLGRRVLIRADVLLDWLRQKSAPSLRE